MKNTDHFFTTHECDRCGKSLSARILSWFNRETICMGCSEKEREIRRALPEYGRAYEGCGYIPKLEELSLSMLG